MVVHGHMIHVVVRRVVHCHVLHLCVAVALSDAAHTNQATISTQKLVYPVAAERPKYWKTIESMGWDRDGAGRDTPPLPPQESGELHIQ